MRVHLGAFILCHINYKPIAKIKKFESGVFELLLGAGPSSITFKKYDDNKRNPFYLRYAPSVGP